MFTFERLAVITIHKFELKFGLHTILIPRGAELLTVQTQSFNRIFLWARVNTDNPLEEVTFKVVGTGQDIATEDLLTYIGTVQLPPFILHCFRVSYQD